MAWRNNKNIDELIEVLDNEKEIIVFDLETTGLSRIKSRVIQCSGIKYGIEDGTFKEKEILDIYINPGISLPPKITEITGITDKMLEDKMTEDVLFDTVIRPFFGDSPVLAGYNSRTFDTLMLKAMYERYGYQFTPKHDVDVLRLSKDFIANESIELPNKKLASIAQHYGADVGITFHNSLDDVRATSRLLMIFKNKAIEKIEKESREVTKKIIPTINKVIYWAGYRGHSRAYIKTDCGDFYYDSYKKEWGTSKTNVFSQDEVDMDALQQKAWDKYGVTCDEDFFKKVKKESA